jgi:hypothetical protein
MHKKMFALSLFASAVYSAWWLRPAIDMQANAAELPTEQVAARPGKKAPSNAASSQPSHSSSCFRGSFTPKPKSESNVKVSDVTLGTSFVIPKEIAKGTSHIPAVNYRIDGEKLFTVTSTGNLFVWDTDTQKIEENILLTKEPLQSVTIDPRGCFAAWSTKDSFSILALGDKHPTTVQKLSPQSISISPNQDVVALSFKDRVELRSTEDASLQKELKSFSGDVTNLSYSPDGKTLAVTTRSGKLSLIDTASYKEKTVQKMGPIYAVAFSPDSKFVAFGGEERIVYQRELSTAKEEVITKDQPFWITTVSYSPDGEMIAFGDESCDVWLFDRDEKKNLFHSKHHVECWLSGIAWTPDSNVFLFGCKPNTYDGSPRIHTPNHAHEANNASEVVKLDQEIQKNGETLARLLDSEEMAEYRKRYELAVKSQLSARNVILNHNEFGNGANGWNGLNNFSPNGSPNGYFPNVVFNNDNNVNNVVILNNNNSINEIGSNNFASILGTLSNTVYLTPEVKKLFEEMKNDPKLKDVVSTQWSLNEKRDKSFNETLAYLNESFCVNQWVVKR